MKVKIENIEFDFEKWTFFSANVLTGIICNGKKQRKDTNYGHKNRRKYSECFVCFYLDK